MKKHTLFLTAISCLILFYSCSKDYLGLSNKNFNNEISPLTNLEFTFTEDVVADSLVGVWQDVA
ncbi:MAG TPA: hypothetical protein VL947_08530, partial [Cytophagales bacterium]|nr:hypothetical protein [Cytophagales bacterium]